MPKIVPSAVTAKAKELATAAAPLAAAAAAKAAPAASAAAAAAAPAATAAAAAAMRAANVDPREFEAMREELRALKEAAKAKGLDAAERVADKALDKVRDKIIGDLTSDRDMPGVVRRAATRAVEDLWPDVKIELAGTVDRAVLERVAVEAGKRAPTCLGRVRAAFLYAWQPFDRSVWGRMRNPLWWLLRLLTLVPVLGVREAVFAVALLLIALPAPADEFQLTRYILSLKSGQFVTGFGVASVAGAWQYYSCVNFDETGRVHACGDRGPGAQLELLAELLGFAASAVLAWVAYALLPGSQKKGEGFYVSRPLGEAGRRGGRLWGLLKWDLLALAAAMGVGAALVLVNSSESSWDDTSFSALADNWQFRASVYWTRVVYSFLTLPWAVAGLPVVRRVLTHAWPTGFARSGECVPLGVGVGGGGGGGGVGVGVEEV